MLGSLGSLLSFMVVSLVILNLQIVSLVADEHARQPNFTTAKIFLNAVDTNALTSFTVRLAITETERAFGLMNTPSLQPYTGMLFLFPDTKPRSFWMKNTPISLDMLFFDGDGRLVNIIPNAVPQSLILRHSIKGAKYVLEIGGGEAARLRLKVGAHLQLPVTATANLYFSQ